MPTVRVTCPTCATRLELAADHLGQEVQCGSCHQIFVAKEERRARPGDEDDDRPTPRHSKFRRESDDDDDDDFDDRPRRRRRRRAGVGGGGTLGTVSLVLGLLSIPLACCCGLFSVPVSAGGLVCGLIGLRDRDARGTALPGAICSGIGLVLMVAVVALGLAVNLGNFGNRFNRPPNQNPPQPWVNPPAPNRPQWQPGMPPQRNFR